MKKSLLAILLVLVMMLTLVLSSCFGSEESTDSSSQSQITQNDNDKDNDDKNSDSTESDSNEENGGKTEEVVYKATHTATIVIEEFGTIELELYGELAPITVANFVALAEDGFYDGLTFHRIMSNFMIQGGGFNVRGAQIPADSIKGEFLSNGFNNPIKHERGVISMARTDDKDSASSQFFIMHADSPHLDGEYAAFGKVTSGIEVVDKICDEVPQGYNGAVEHWHRPIIDSITVKEVSADDKENEDGKVYYTVNVVDELGNAVKGVNLQICTDTFCLPPMETDENGTAVYEFDKTMDFKIQFNSVPEGYELPTEKFSFPDGSTEATLTLVANNK